MLRERRQPVPVRPRYGLCQAPLGLTLTRQRLLLHTSLISIRSPAINMTSILHELNACVGKYCQYRRLIWSIVRVIWLAFHFMETMYVLLVNSSRLNRLGVYWLINVASWETIDKKPMPLLSYDHFFLKERSNITDIIPMLCMHTSIVN